MSEVEVVNRVEVIIEYGLPSRELIILKEWLVGWLYSRGLRDIKVAEGDDLIVLEVEGDMFKLFNELRVAVKLMLRDVRAGVKAFGVCSGDECVVVDDIRFEMVLPDHVLNKLEKVVNRVGRIAGYGRVEGIEVVNRSGLIAVYMGGCYARLYVNEAFVVATDLVRFAEDVSGLELVKGIGLIYDVFELPEPRSIDVDLITDEGGVMLFVDGCSRYLKVGEVLKVAYWLMRLSLNELLLKREIEKWGHE